MLAESARLKVGKAGDKKLYGRILPRHFFKLDSDVKIKLMQEAELFKICVLLEFGWNWTKKLLYVSPFESC